MRIEGEALADTNAKNDMSFFHKFDPEWSKYSSDNAQGGNGILLFGRKTYELMASFWPTDDAKKQMPEIAEGPTFKNGNIVATYEPA